MIDAQLPIWISIEPGQAPEWFLPDGWGAFTYEGERWNFLSEKAAKKPATSQRLILLIPRESELRLRVTGMDETLGVELSALDLVATIDWFPQALPQAQKMTPSLQHLLATISEATIAPGNRIPHAFAAAREALAWSCESAVSELGNALLEDDETINAAPGKIAALASNLLRKQNAGIEIASVTLHEMHPVGQALPLWRGDPAARWLGTFFPGFAMPNYAETFAELYDPPQIVEMLEELLRLLTCEGLATPQRLQRYAQAIVDDEEPEDAALSVEALLAPLRPLIIAPASLANVVTMPLPGDESQALAFARLHGGRRTLGKPLEVDGHPEEGPTCTVQMGAYLIALDPISRHVAWLMSMPGSRPHDQSALTGSSWNALARGIGKLGTHAHLPSEAQWFAAIEAGRLQPSSASLEWCADTWSGDVYAHPALLDGPAALNTQDPHARNLRSVRDAARGIYWRNARDPHDAPEEICGRLTITLEENQR